MGIGNCRRLRAGVLVCLAVYACAAPAQIITTIAGGWTGDGGPATSAVIGAGPSAVDSAGNIYVADNLNYRVRKVAPNGVISTVLGTGTTGFSSGEGPALSINLSYVYALVLDTAGNLYVGDAGRVLKVTPAGMAGVYAGSIGGGRRDSCLIALATSMPRIAATASCARWRPTAPSQPSRVSAVS
jgi:hypothetical protein